MTRWPPVAGCSPSALLLASLLMLLGSTQVHDVRTGLVVLAAVAVLAPLAVRRVQDAARRVLPGALAATSLGASTWWIAGGEPATALTAGLRILALVVPGSLLAAWVDPSRLGDELAQWLRLPARPVVAAVAALQQVEALGEQWRTLDRVRHARGLGPGPWPWSQARHAAALTFALLVHTVRRSGRLAVAMDARGFADAHRRTWAQAPRWGPGDSLLVAGAAVVALLPVLAG